MLQPADNIIMWVCQHESCDKPAIYRPGMDKPLCRLHQVERLVSALNGEAKP